MKRSGKIVLGVGTVLAVFGAGAAWLIHSAVGVVNDAVTTTLSEGQKIEGAAHREIAGAAQGAKAQAGSVVAAAQKTLDGADDNAKPNAANNGSANATGANAAGGNVVTAPTAAPSDTVKGSAPLAAAPNSPNDAPKIASAKKKGEPSDWDDMMDIGKALLPMLGDDDANPLDFKAVLDKVDNPGKTGPPKAETAEADKKDADSDDLTDMIPGANSQTVKKWRAGKYKGKESQAVDDALEDPQVLRALFTFVGM